MGSVEPSRGDENNSDADTRFDNNLSRNLIPVYNTKFRITSFISWEPHRHTPDSGILTSSAAPSRL